MSTPKLTDEELSRILSFVETGELYFEESSRCYAAAAYAFGQNSASCDLSDTECSRFWAIDRAIRRAHKREELLELPEHVVHPGSADVALEVLREAGLV